MRPGALWLPRRCAFFEQGWSTLRNRELLWAAEAGGFKVLLTTDTNLRHQQNLTNRAIAILVLKKHAGYASKPSSLA
jgi:hypothetical protein